MKIVYVRFQDFDKRFYLTSERELLRAFIDLGYEAELIGIGSKKDEPAFVKLFSAFKKNHIANKVLISLYLLKYLFSETVVVFDNLSYLMAVPLLLARKTLNGKARVMMDVRGIPVETYKIYEYRKYNSSLIFARKYMDGVTFITEGTRILTERMTKRKFHNYRIYPSGFNDEIMKPVQRDNNLAEKLFISEDDFVVFYHGSISKSRGVKELVEGVELLKKKYRVKLFVIGGGESEIIEMIKNGKGNIFMDPVAHDEIPKYISLADACASPLPDILWWRVASSLKVMEYMACGKPLILSRMKAHTDVAPENGDGVSYFDEVTPESIANAIEKIIQRKDEWHSKRDSIVNHAKSKFSYRVLASELIAFYRIVFSGKKIPCLESSYSLVKEKPQNKALSKNKISSIVYVRVQDIDKKFYLTSQRELIRSFNNLGIDGELIAYGKRADEPEFVKLLNFKYNKPIFIKLKIMFHLLRYAKSRAVIIFGKLSYLTSILLLIIRAIFGGSYRLVFDVRSIPVEVKKKSNIMKFKNSLHFAYRFFDGYTFITEGTKKVCDLYIRKRFKNFELFPSGFNEEIMKPLEDNRLLKKTLGMDNSVKIIFYHGSISKRRGVIELIEAVKILNATRNVMLVVVGDGDAEIIEEIKKNDSAVYLPPVNHTEVPRYISIADVCVSPLPDILWWRISSSLKVMEYMACGKPIALSRMKAHTDVVPLNSAAISFFDSVDPVSIANAIEPLLAGTESIAHDAKKLREHAIEKYTYDSIAKKVLEYYEKL